MIYHYQCRLAKHSEGSRVITYQLLGAMYAHGQKTLKSYHTEEEAIKAALEYNKNLSPEAPEPSGFVITRFRGSSHPRRYTTPGGRQAYRKEVREEDTTQWLLFIDRNGQRYKLDPKLHVILPSCDNVVE